ncbi:MAG: efflux RND transporter periplasmic adaptor subunit, partial [Betaproteobacteria bacterium]|nr:efflux RND transporter periplasmic adaptor subunit [Betaproteobacteria bacterium]
REKNFISQAELDRRISTYDSTDARLDAVRAQYRQAANQAGYAVLSADHAGVITAVESEAGQVVAVGQTIVRLARSGETEVVVAVPENQRDAFERAGAFSVTLNAFPGRSWKSKLRELSPAADPVTRTYLAKVTVIEPGRDVELGMSARVSAEVSTAEKRIELPVSALYGKGEAMGVLAKRMGHATSATTGRCSAVARRAARACSRLEVARHVGRSLQPVRRGAQVS